MEKIIKASDFGFPCSRKIWYSVNGYERKHEDEINWILETGRCLEPMIAYRLLCEDWKVEYNEGSQEAMIEYKIPLSHGVLRGHPDCFISKGDTQNVLADIKTMNDWNYKRWRKDGSLKEKPGYVDQLHVYAMGAISSGRAVEHLAIVGFNKNNSDMFVDIFDYDPERAQAIKNRAEEILSAEAPPTEDLHTTKWACTYCDYADICDERQGEK